jgi:ABC-2 type transport system permease protein
MRGLFPNAFHVARREYLFRVRGRAFVVTTLLLAAVVVASALLPTFLGALGVADPAEIAVSDEAGDLPVDPVQAVQGVLSATAEASGDEGARVVLVDDPDEAAERVRAGELDGLLVISRGESGELAFEYLSDQTPGSQTRILVTQAATALATADRMDQAGIAPEQAATLFAPADFTATAVDPDAAVEEEDFGGALLLSYVVVILTFMAILTYGNWVAQSVAEEKSGRVMELLITAATPRQLLVGKVFGTGAAGLTQFVAIIVAFGIGLVATGPVAGALGAQGQAPFELPQIDPGFLATFTAFFLLGFLLYCTLYAAAGSMVSRVEDAQQAAGPLIYLAIGGYLLSFFAPNDPDGQLMAIASIVPFFSPYLMPTRMLLGDPASWEVVLALVLLVLTLAAALWIAARIYSAGVLLYGQRVGFRNVWRASRVAR